MDPVEKKGLFDSTEFQIDVLLLHVDINRPEVSPRWLCNNRRSVQRGLCMTSHVGLVLPDSWGKGEEEEEEEWHPQAQRHTK